MSTLRSLFKDTFLYGVASVLPRIISFALVGVYTAVFTADDFSRQTKWYVYAAFLNIILTMGLETSFFRFYTMREKASSRNYDQNQVLAISFFLLLAITGAFMAITFFWESQISGFFGFEKPLFLRILVGITVLDTLVVIPFSLIRAEGRAIRFLLLKAANILIMAAITLFLLYVLPQNPGSWQFLCFSAGCFENYQPEIEHIFIANAIASAATFLLVVPELRRIPRPHDWSLLRLMLSYSWPVMVAGLAYVINENLDKLLIATWAGEEANGIYAACYKLGVFMTLYITAFRLGAEPFFFRHAHLDDAKEKYSLMMTLFVLFGAVFMVGVMANLDLISSFFLRRQIYQTGLHIVPVILLANLFSGIYANLAIWYKLSDKTWYGMNISIFGAVMTFLTLWMMVPGWGIAGGAYATLFTYALMALLSWYLGQRVYPIPYQTGKLLLVIGLAFGVSLLCFYAFRENTAVRWLLWVLFTACIAFLGRNELGMLGKDR